MNDSIENLANKASKLLFDNSADGKKIIKNKIIELMFDLRNFKCDFDFINKLNEIFYQIENEMKEEDRHTKKEIFFLCLYDLENRVRFKNTIGTVKEFSYTKIVTKVEECLPFLKGNYTIHIPTNPNQQYHTTLNILNQITKCKEEVNTTLLNIVYDKKRKAKKPKLSTGDLIAQKNNLLAFSKSHTSAKEVVLKDIEKIERLLKQRK